MTQLLSPAFKQMPTRVFAVALSAIDYQLQSMKTVNVKTQSASDYLVLLLG